MKNILEIIDKKHAELLKLQPKLSVDLAKNLYEWFRIALTYTSNAIEGNTLTHVETAQVIEKNITIAGKSLTEHLEAINHAEAVDFTKNLADLKSKKDIDLSDILQVHQLILQRINSDNAGKIRTVPVRIMGSNIPVPNYLKVPVLMDDLITWLHSTNEYTPKIAADIHLKLAFIHPFVDGNGRTARLLMNLILLQQNYPLVFIKVEDRVKYIKAIQKALDFASGNFSAEEFVLKDLSLEETAFQDYYKIIFEAIEYSLDQYIQAISE